MRPNLSTRQRSEPSPPKCSCCFSPSCAQGYLIAGIFFGLWLLSLGYLLYRSGYFPRVLGIMLMVGCFGYLTDAFVASLYPSVGLIFRLMAGIAEISFLLWLLIMGAKVPQRDEQTTPAEVEAGA